jgi:hypothetical protein
MQAVNSDEIQMLLHSTAHYNKLLHVMHCAAQLHNKMLPGTMQRNIVSHALHFTSLDSPEPEGYEGHDRDLGGESLGGGHSMLPTGIQIHT